MFRPHVTLGPPGTGKSRSILRNLVDEIARGVPPHRIAVVTFTRAARSVVFERLSAEVGLAGESFPWVRTIHSAAYRLLDVAPGRIFDDERWQEFADLYGYTFSPVGTDASDVDADVAPLPEQTEDDRVRFTYDWGRNCLLTREQTLARVRQKSIRAPHFLEYVERLERFKRERDLLDFCDLLTRVLQTGARPAVRVAPLRQRG